MGSRTGKVRDPVFRLRTKACRTSLGAARLLTFLLLVFRMEGFENAYRTN